MNRIYLDKLYEFSLNTYKNNNYYQESKNIILNELIESIKQNNSLNEKAVHNKYNYVELMNLIPEIEFNELILLSPLCFNIEESNLRWYNLLNSLLIILNDEYMYETNIKKKLILDTTDKIYKKKINVTNILSDNLLDKIASLTSITIILLSTSLQNIKIYNLTAHESPKIIVLYQYNNEFYPVINWLQKFYTFNDEFIKNLISIYETIKIKKNIDNADNADNTDNTDNSDNNSKSKKVSKTRKVNKSKVEKTVKVKTQKIKTKQIEQLEQIEQVEEIDNNINDDTKNDLYEELVTNENYALYISEVTDNKNNIKKNKNLISSDSKRKSKNSKDIFMINKENNLKNDCTNKNNLDEDSTFKKTEIITKDIVSNIKNNLKSTLVLSDLQAYAIKLNINIFSGSTKEGKPKNKTKTQLLDDLKVKIEEYEK